jgi:hypothetical protein
MRDGSCRDDGKRSAGGGVLISVFVRGAMSYIWNGMG